MQAAVLALPKDAAEVMEARLRDSLFGQETSQPLSAFAEQLRAISLPNASETLTNVFD